MSFLKWLRHLFIPHQSNNHKAGILHPASLSVLVAIFLTGQFFLNFFTLVSPSILGFASNISPDKIVELTNQKRAEQGLSPLNVNGLLNEVAQRKAGDMFAFNYWAHISPSGRDPWFFFKEAGYRYVYAGENLARDFMDSGAVVEAWMNSPTHKDNLINSQYKEIGVAVVNGTLNGVETTLVVQVFGTPTPAWVAEKPVQATSPQPTLPPLPQPELGEASQVQESPLSTYVYAQAKEATASPPLFSPFWLTKTIAIFLLGIVLGALAIDGFLVYRLKVVRLSSRTLAHLIFLATLLLAIILTTPGAIL
jgi:uncharacterized protein YkwD